MENFTESTQAVNDELACSGCGAMLKFKPGTHTLVCAYCGASNEIPGANETAEIVENSLEDFLAQHVEREAHTEAIVVKCDSCGATCTLAPNTVSDQCPFCASALVVKGGTVSSVHKPQYLLPFNIDQKAALANFKRWLKALWFAPSDLKQYADRVDRMAGIYLPFWTFDCQTDTWYTGQRGEDYIDTETYTTMENGKSVTRTRQVTRTHWYSASGRVANDFDDILIEATQSLPKDKLRALEPWDLKNLTAYHDQYLSGFRTEIYTVDIRNGYTEAKTRMQPAIHNTICNDIGGDRQLIHTQKTTYKSPSFKHILLPVWLSAYRYNDKVYQIFINARTGEVQGDRPYSVLKITLAVVLGLLVIAAIYFLTQ